MTEKDLDGRVIVVTGASRGIGAAAARNAAARGAHVIAVARTVGGLEELDDDIQKAGGDTTLVPFDLTDYAAIDRLGAAINERWGRLDGLIGNAGVLGILSPLAHIDPKVFENAVAVNVTANYRLIRSLDPLLRQSDAGRVVMVSSGAARSARAYWGLYALTKAALDTMVKSYAGELAKTSVKANAFYPGIVRTKMRAQAMPGEDPDTLPHPDEVAPRLVDMVAPAYRENGMLFDAGKGTTEAL
ncbi:MAG: SDR family NAD(P)-dependent oxidoreductase [Alphaproteobacteria bacterium]|nr:SDR family NAD(P)-dependent oxidoreductase [Alphaproteobacteria bacterium]